MGLDLEGSARRCGALRWAELRLFEILGSWVASTPEPEAKLMLDRHSQHHAWRANQWWDRLPVLAGADRDSLAVPPSPAADSAAGALSDLDGTVARLAGAYRVALPRLAGAYEELLVLADPVSDGSTVRTLGLVRGDLDADWREGELCLQRLLVSTPAVEVAAATVARLEGLLAGGADQRRRD
ncbi:MAG: hypothetical protein ACRDYY_09695 [Acidimicrobiales bacterium]